MFTYRSPIRANRLTKAEVACARRQRLNELRMWSIIREIFIYLFFLSLLYIVTYSNQQSNSSVQVEHLRKYLLNLRQIDCDYTQVCLSCKIFHYC